MDRQKGQTLIEVLVALSASVVIVSAITVAVITSLSNTEFSRNQNLATQYAQQGMEVVRSIRNNNYGNLQSLLGSYCFDKMCSSFVNTPSVACGQKTFQYSCGTNIDNTFVRQLDVSPPDITANDCNKTSYKVSVSVSWTDSKCTSTQNVYCHVVSLSSCLSDFTVMPTPQ